MRTSNVSNVAATSRRSTAGMSPVAGNRSTAPAVELMAFLSCRCCFQAGCFGQGRCLVGVFPAEIGIVAAEVTAGCRLAIAGSPQVEILNDAAGRQRKELADNLAQPLVIDPAGPLRIDIYTYWLDDSDRISELHFAPLGKSSSDDIFCHVAGHISRAAIDLGGVLAAESAAAMPTPTTIGIDDDLAASQSAVAVGAADDKIPRRIDVVLDVAAGQISRQLRLNDLVDDVVVELRLRNVRRVLCAHDDRIDPQSPIAIVFDRHLALAIRPQPIDLALLTDAGQPIEDSMGQCNRQRHQLGRFVTGIAKHQALIAGASRSTPIAMSGLWLWSLTSTVQ